MHAWTSPGYISAHRVHAHFFSGRHMCGSVLCSNGLLRLKSEPLYLNKNPLQFIKSQGVQNGLQICVSFFRSDGMTVDAPFEIFYRFPWFSEH